MTMSSSSDEDDPVVGEVDVFLSQQLAHALYLFQYPVRAGHLPYDEVDHLSARVKPKQQKVEIELAINTQSVNYSESKGEQIALNVDGRNPGSDASYTSKKLDKQVLSSNPVGIPVGRYVAGMYKDGELHLTPLKGIVQLRPGFEYLDKADAHKKSETGVDPESQDEEEEAKPVQVRFARRETEDAKARRLASYEYLHKRREEEPWISVHHHQMDSNKAARERHRLFAEKTEEVTEFQMSSAQYLQKILPRIESEQAAKPALPNNVLSLAELKTMSLNDQVKALIKNVKVMKFSQILELLPKGSDHMSVIRALQQVAVLVQGCWVVKSEVLYPRDSFSAHSGVPSEALCRGRDYIMWRFTQSSNVIRKDVSTVVKLPAEDVKDVLEQIACLRANKGWEFLREYDTEFVSRHPEVVQRQQLLWDAKFKQLSSVLKISKADLQKAARSFDGTPVSPDRGRRKRTNSRQRSHSGGRSFSDQSDSETDIGKKGRRSRHNCSASGSEKAAEFDFSSVTVKQEVVSNHVLNGPSGDGELLTPKDELHQELQKFAYDKLMSRYVFTLSELRSLFHLHLAQAQPGHILGTGVSDVQLEQAVISTGGIRLNNQWPPQSKEEPLFVYTNTPDGMSNTRNVIVNMFCDSPRFKSNMLKKKLEEKYPDNVPSENVLKKLIKDYCTSKGGNWYLKGTTVMDS